MDLQTKTKAIFISNNTELYNLPLFFMIPPETKLKPGKMFLYYLVCRPDQKLPSKTNIQWNATLTPSTPIQKTKWQYESKMKT